jgi:ABC-type transport system involved in multi-copper enzyme maturation permease subunit
MTANSQLQTVEEQGWLSGLENLLRKENNQWWRTRKWWIQALTWLVLSNGLLAVILWLIPALESSSSFKPTSQDLVAVFMNIHSLFATLGVMILAQGLVVREKQSGTASWVMSNPVSPGAFILAKLIANGLAIFAIVIGLQFAVGYLQIALKSQEVFNPVPLLAGIALLVIYLLFYLALSLLLGTIFNNTGPVIGISIGLWIGLQLVQGLLGGYLPWLRHVLPDSVLSLATAAAQGQTLSGDWYLPVIFTLILSLGCIAGATWRFGREEY